MTTLLYTTAFGDPVFMRLAENMMKSARAMGYDGDSLILRDGHCLPGMPKAGLLRALPRDAVESYDKILFVDSDCVFVKNPKPLFAVDGFGLVAEGKTINLYNALFLTPEEKREAEGAAPRLNGGIFLMPGKGARDFLSAWEEAWLAAPRDEIRRDPRYAWVPQAMMDQPALQAMVLRKALPYTLLPGVGFRNLRDDPEGKRVPGDAVVIHFCGDLGRGSHVRNKKFLVQALAARPVVGKKDET